MDQPFQVICWKLFSHWNWQSKNTCANYSVSWGEIAPTRPPTSHQAISPQLLTLLSSLVVSPSLSRRTFKVPGRGPVPQGRPLQDGREKFKWSSRKMVIWSLDQAKPSNLQQRRSTSWQNVSKKMKLLPKTHQALNCIIKIVCKMI